MRTVKGLLLFTSYISSSYAIQCPILTCNPKLDDGTCYVSDGMVPAVKLQGKDCTSGS